MLCSGKNEAKNNFATLTSLGCFALVCFVAVVVVVVATDNTTAYYILHCTYEHIHI